MSSRRSWYLLVLVCLLALAGSRAFHGSTPQSSSQGLVPWTGARVETATLAQQVAPPPCRVGALDLPQDQQRWGGVWNDASAGYLVIENAGARTCELPPPSKVTARTPSGARVPFDASRLGVPAVALGPGDAVQVQVSSPYDCGKPLNQSATFGFTFPTGTLHVSNARMAVQCGGALVDFTARGGGTSAAGTTSAPPSSRLVATISQVPDTISPDHSVSYAVTLTNPTSAPIRLDTCPVYQEGIKGRPATVQTYQLNCDAVSRIDAHDSVRFAMKLPLPPQLEPGAVVLNWRLQAPPQALDAGQFTSASTHVR